MICVEGMRGVRDHQQCQIAERRRPISWVSDADLVRNAHWYGNIQN